MQLFFQNFKYASDTKEYLKMFFARVSVKIISHFFLNIEIFRFNQIFLSNHPFQSFLVSKTNIYLI